MEMNIKTNGSEMVVSLDGRLDTSTAPEMEKNLGPQLEGIDSLILDFEKLHYISSAGLRVLLSTQKKMNAKKGTMVIRNVNEMNMEVFEVTGFLDILTVENGYTGGRKD